MRIVTIAALSLLLAPILVAQTSTPLAAAAGKSTDNSNCGLLYGKNHALTFCAPDGWVLDNSIMNDQGIYAVFYPQGSTWEEARDHGTFMYINVVSRSPNSTVAKMMADDKEETMHHSPSTIVSEGQTIEIGKAPVPVQRFDLGANSGSEAVAYICEEKVLVMFVISSTSQVGLTRDYPAFVSLVRSYKFLGSNVTIQQK